MNDRLVLEMKALNKQELDTEIVYEETCFSLTPNA